jgi:hypothetical protein
MVEEESVHYSTCQAIPTRRKSGGPKEESALTARDATTGRSGRRSTIKAPFVLLVRTAHELHQKKPSSVLPALPELPPRAGAVPPRSHPRARRLRDAQL